MTLLTSWWLQWSAARQHAQTQRTAELRRRASQGFDDNAHIQAERTRRAR